MAESRVALTSTWALVYTRDAGDSRLILSDPAQAGDICFTTDPSLAGTTTVGGVAIGIGFDTADLKPPAKVWARSPSSASLTVVVC